MNDSLRASEQLLQRVIEAFPGGIARVTADGRFTLANAEASRSLGLSPAGLRSATLDRWKGQLLRPDGSNLPLHETPLSRCSRTGVTQGPETIGVRVNGQVVWLLVRAAPLAGPDGAADGCVVAYFDVTHMERVRRQLEEAEQRWRMSLEAAKAGSWIRDLTTGAATWDQRMAAIYGVDLERFGGSTEDWLGLVHPDDRESVRERVREATEGSGPYEAEYRIQPPAVGIRYVEDHGLVVRSTDGEPLRMTGLCLDITERRQARHELEQAVVEADRQTLVSNERAADLQRLNDELADFAHTASHDLQEPLRTMVSYSTLLRQDAGDDLPEAAAEDVELIQQAAYRMQRLIQDLLSLSRAGRAEVRMEPTPLRECVDAALSSLSVRLRESGASVGVADLPVVIADRSLLTQVFQNLISNAIKFCRDQAPSVRISAGRRHGMWIIGVKDNGIGIDPIYFDRIFLPFRRLHGMTVEGSGIGLAICRKVIERHGGRIWVEPNPDGGSSFHFSLPDAEVESTDAETVDDSVPVA